MIKKKVTNDKKKIGMILYPSIKHFKSEIKEHK